MSENFRQSKSELWAHLEEQLRFMRRSCEFFDQGDTAEAKRLAAHVATLVIHVEPERKKTSKSLLRQLRLLPDMGFIDTAPRQPKGWTTPFGDAKLVMARLTLMPNGESTGQYEALCRLAEPPPFSRERVELFGRWLDSPVIITQTRRYSRGDVVRLLRNKLGGGHVDPDLEESGAALTRGNPLVTEYQMNDGPPIKLSGIELHTMRQIAHEVIRSVERKLAKG